MCTILTIAVFLAGCSPMQEESNKTNNRYIKGVWISYSEMDQLLEGDFKLEFIKVVQNCKNRGITDLFVHMVPFCDAYYMSDVFPLRITVAKYDFDVLEYMITECHKNEIDFHAWINPYRVKTKDNDISTLDSNSPVKTVLNEKDVSFTGGIYLNPASVRARELILDGIRELINKYNVDGIHFDDYFYPTTDPSFDSESYSDYSSATAKPIGLDEWRRANVNALISGVYTAIKFKDKNIIFSISPSADVEQNYSQKYADVAAWVRSDCIDYIIPQLYFGFEYPVEKYRFNNLLNEWQKITDGKNAKLIIGLAAYKINTQNEPDKQEWSNGKTIIAQQTKICEENEKISGHIYFSYSFVCEHL